MEKEGTRLSWETQKWVSVRLENVVLWTYVGMISCPNPCDFVAYVQKQDSSMLFTRDLSVQPSL
jgi:hypothetical protein